MRGLRLGLGKMNHRDKEAMWEMGPEESADGASRTEGILFQLGRGEQPRAQVWPEPGS